MLVRPIFFSPQKHAFATRRRMRRADGAAPRLDNTSGGLDPAPERNKKGPTEWPTLFVNSIKTTEQQEQLEFQQELKRQQQEQLS